MQKTVCWGETAEEFQNLQCLLELHPVLELLLGSPDLSQCRRQRESAPVRIARHCHPQAESEREEESRTCPLSRLRCWELFGQQEENESLSLFSLCSRNYMFL
jgi:hypothetical protein